MAEIYIEKCRDTAVIPAYAHPGDAGMDIYAAADVIVEPGRSVLVPGALGTLKGVLREIPLLGLICTSYPTGMAILRPVGTSTLLPGSTITSAAA